MTQRQLMWMDQVLDADVGNGGTLTAKLFDPSSQTRGLEHSTVTRLIIGTNIFPATLTETSGAQRLAIGIGVASIESIDLGATALPDPSVNDQFPAGGWLYRAGYVVVAGTSESSQRLDVDLGAARKLQNGGVFLFLRNTAQVATAFTVTMAGQIRILLRMP